MATNNGVALFGNTMQSDLALLDVLLVSCLTCVRNAKANDVALGRDINGK